MITPSQLTTAVCAELLKLVSIINSGFEPSEEDLRVATLAAAEAMAAVAEGSFNGGAAQPT